MTPNRPCSLRSFLLLQYAAFGCLVATSFFYPSKVLASDFLPPTAAELSMTSLPGYPGVPAVVLYREEITKDDLHSVQHYERIKILTEEGKKYANVELGFFSSLGTYYSGGDDKKLEQISARTIHPDGKIIPFNGKPYLKVLEKTSGYKIQQKIFTLPEAEVGSIIEYRYSTFINDNRYEAPTWMIQDNLFVKDAYFAWWPTTQSLVDGDQKVINAITWFPILPPGAKIENRDLHKSGLFGGDSQIYEVHVKDIPPRVKEEHMPPIGSFSYRVYFSFTPYHSPQDYWQSIGKDWSKRVNSFAGPSGALHEKTEKVIAGASTSDERLHKIYAAVMALENTQYTRARDQREDKAAGLGQLKDASDVLTHGRGTPSQLAELFLGMTRAAGFKSYLMWVPDRSDEIFLSNWLSTRQLDDYIVIVNDGGKDILFDPGSRYCAYGQLAWQHTLVQGLRQTESGTDFGQTASTSYKTNQVTRVANLTMGSDGEVTGKVDLTFNGSSALYWRQAALRGDDEELRKQLRESAEGMLPRTLDIKVAEVQGISDFEKPLTVHYQVKGPLGNAMGKRTMVPADVFLANPSATFSHEKRDTAVYFDYPQSIRDAVRVNLPPTLAIEAVPTPAKYDLPNTGLYSLQVTEAPTNITTRRDFIFNDVLVEPKKYPQLRSFYSQFESKDQESVILKPVAATSASAATGAPAK